MTSAIISNSIDENFPVAGQDNDSQGFRDNFNIIKTALAVAKTEITDLQDGVARIDGDNNFDYNAIINAEFRGCVELVEETNATGTSDNENLDYNQGSVFVIKATGNIALNFQNWPNDGYAQARVFLTGDGTARTITFTTENSGTVKTDGNVAWSGDSLSVTSISNPTVVEAFTYNNGVNVYLRYLGSFS
jgi:hypothetical protein